LACLSRILLGRPYSPVHQFMDLPYPILGRRHRELLHNLLIDPWILAALLNDPQAAAASAIHILQDSAVGWLTKLLKQN